jgi:lysophospholipid hydrolase
MGKLKVDLLFEFDQDSNDLQSAGWLANLEERYHTVLYVADAPVNSSWTQTCIRQADCVMVVGMGDDPTTGEYERLLLSMKTTARKELILLHSDRSVTSGSTREWLKVSTKITVSNSLRIPS